MLALLLASALLAQSVLGAPNNCELCDVENPRSTGGFRSHSSQSSYSSAYRSAFGSGARQIGSSGLGATGGRLENLDENVVTNVGNVNTGGINLDRPGNWQDEKHLITDDGRGQMSFRAGQTVTNNGFSKFASHSYRYGTHESHAPLANSQVVSTAEFEQELQNMRNRIRSFMGNFNIEAGSLISANQIQDFRTKADRITNQLSNVCDQMDHGSLMYQQMRQMMEQFQRDVDQRQRDMEAVMFQSSSSSSHGSLLLPSRPSNQYAPIQQAPVEEDRAVQQQVDEQITRVQNEISSFYTTFRQPDTSSQYVQELNNQVNTITEKLNELNHISNQHESVRLRIDQLKTQFETYVTQMRNRISEIEQKQREEEARHREREEQIRLEKLQYEEKMRQEQMRLEKLQYEEKMRQEQIRLEKIQFEEKMRQLEEQRIRLQQEEEQKAKMRQIEEEKRLLEEQKLRIQQEEEQRARLRKIEEEKLRLKLEQERLERQRERLVVQQPAPQQQVLPQQSHLGGTYEITGKSSYEHSFKSSYGSSSHGSSNGASASYVNQRSQPLLQPHVDLTAAMGRLQQDLNRLQSEVNNFNMYTMRLTSSNSQNLVHEAEREAENLRQRISSLCETSDRYQNNNIHNSAEELGRRFEDLFHAFQAQAANYVQQGNSEISSSGGYSSSSNFGSSSRITAAKPVTANFEYEHSKTTEIEVGSKPATAQNYSSGSSSSGQASFGAKTDDQFTTGLLDLGQGSQGSQQQHVECVEQYSGQPCVNEPTRRYRRDVGGMFEPRRERFYLNRNYKQRYEPTIDDYSYFDRSPISDHRTSTIKESQYNSGNKYGISPQSTKYKTDYLRPAPIAIPTHSFYRQEYNRDPENHYYKRPLLRSASLPENYRKYRRQSDDEILPSQLEISEDQDLPVDYSERMQKSFDQSSNEETTPRPRGFVGSEEMNSYRLRDNQNPILIDKEDKPMPLTHQEMMINQDKPPRSFSNSKLDVEMEEPRVLPIDSIRQSESNENLPIDSPQNSEFYENQQNHKGPAMNLNPILESMRKIGMDEDFEDVTPSNRENTYEMDKGLVDAPYENKEIFVDIMSPKNKQLNEDVISGGKNLNIGYNQEKNIEKSDSYENRGLNVQKESDLDLSPHNESGEHPLSEDVLKEESNVNSYPQLENNNEDNFNNKNQKTQQSDLLDNDTELDQLPSQSTQNFNWQEPNMQTTNINSKIDISSTSEDPLSIVTLYPKDKSAPANSDNDENENEENNEKNDEFETIDVTNLSSQDSGTERKTQPVRGDLPGISYPTTKSPKESPPKIISTERSTEATTTTTTTTQATITESPKITSTESPVEIFTYTTHPTPRRCKQIICQHRPLFNKFSGTYNYTQHHNFKITHTSNRYGNLNSDMHLNQQIQIPRTLQHNQNNGATYRYREHQRGSLRIQHHQPDFEPQQFKPILSELRNNDFAMNRQRNLNQHIERPAFEHYSRHSQHHAVSFQTKSGQAVSNDYTEAIVRPIDGRSSSNIWRDNIQPTTASPSFWQRIGRSLSIF